ncbi:hypothetical protein TCAL_03623 [Tigriopus californicus]|uniref:Uncharacterized protein n=1 Tax=Tigriopus californicus TaxID=6832 RepID=A0A553NF54_TIGCA|nr:protein OPI10 homolog [Tigriopus californicus]TRY64083.1 hypothetical protein TCAL_03623 [Tigriopus californicus]|eukprot:TCALIF_03623-PA protein Name:"Similar to CG13926 Protein OPI10 homolog (Drosophila melanogaster)" AED:0.22 eAED:0.22 QI:0/-1/0/1/-1/1/1/0/202
MFGLLLSGRLVDTNFRQVDPTHVVIDMANVDNVNHIVVFLTGQQPFPEAMGGGVYFAWPDPQSSAPVWQYLGHLSNAKPSAIFKVGKFKSQMRDNHDLIARFGGQQLNGGSVAQLGISVEPLVQLSGMTPEAQAEATNLPTFVEFSQKMVENLFNYTSSFAVSPSEIPRVKSSETFVPYSSLQQWYANFERRLQQNPYFWRS